MSIHFFIDRSLLFLSLWESIEHRFRFVLISSLIINKLFISFGYIGVGLLVLSKRILLSYLASFEIDALDDRLKRFKSENINFHANTMENWNLRWKQEESNSRSSSARWLQWKWKIACCLLIDNGYESHTNRAQDGKHTNEKSNI